MTYLGYYSLAFAVISPYFKNEIDHFLPLSNAKFFNIFSSSGCSPILLPISSLLLL